MRMFVKVLCSAAVPLGLLAAAPATAASPPPRPVAATCGAVLHHNAYLRADLHCSAGLTVVGNITLDLRGHALIASGAQAGVGLLVSGAGSPTVKNGKVTGWSTGMTVEPSDEAVPDRNIHVSHVTFAGSSTAIDAGAQFSVNKFTITGSTFVGNTVGLNVSNNSATVQGSVFTKNASAVNADTASVAVSNSRLTGGRIGVSCEESTCTLTGNVLSGNTTAVLSLNLGTVSMTRNVLTGNKSGVSQQGLSGIELTENAFARNTIGVEVAAAANLTGNVFTDNTDGLTAGGSVDASQDVRVTRNTFVHNINGIYLPEGGVKLAQNLAAVNKRWGIYAPGGVDLGGNKSFANGKSPQCVGVVCR